jgi:hypothetical protein
MTHPLEFGARHHDLEPDHAPQPAMDRAVLVGKSPARMSAMTSTPNRGRNEPTRPIAWDVVEPRVGIEPTTYALRMRCSTD